MIVFTWKGKLNATPLACPNCNLTLRFERYSQGGGFPGNAYYSWANDPQEAYCSCGLVVGVGLDGVYFKPDKSTDFGCDQHEAYTIQVLQGEFGFSFLEILTAAHSIRNLPGGTPELFRNLCREARETGTPLHAMAVNMHQLMAKLGQGNG